VRAFWFTAALVIASSIASAQEEEPTPVPRPPERELSLAERAEAAKKQADASNKDRKPGGRVLNNEDLKKAKGNVIYLQAPASAASPRVSSSSVLPSTTSPSEVPVVVTKVLVPASSDLVRELDESRGRAMRLRTTIEDTQRALSEAPSGEGRTALEERLRSTLNELLLTQEAIGVLSERMRQSDPSSSSTDK
jgi:hypothetical protein